MGLFQRVYVFVTGSTLAHKAVVIVPGAITTFAASANSFIEGSARKLRSRQPTIPTPLACPPPARRLEMRLLLPVPAAGTSFPAPRSQVRH